LEYTILYRLEATGQRQQGRRPKSVDTTQAWPYNRSHFETGLIRSGNQVNESALNRRF